MAIAGVAGTLVLVALIAAIVPADPSDGTARSKDGVTIHYSVQGKGEPTLVFVHGWAFDRKLWDGEVPQFATHHRVVTLDLAGHGQSGRDRKDWTMAAFGEDVKAVVEAAKPGHMILIGHSMGGPVVLEAARHLGDRVKAIVLVDTLLDVDQHIPPDDIEGFIKRLAADYPGVMKNSVPDRLFSASTPARVRERVLKQALALPADISIAMLRSNMAYDPAPALKEIKAPIRAVSADKYPTNLDANRRLMPGYQTVILKGSGHYPMLEMPSAFHVALDGVLKAIIRP